ncbi:lectin BRA-3-like [Mytilus californianus]|uniref:lectin BRA-3-like n=1 Tax=Mytilus californianus TaxID=6549 RepID=UPI002247A62D|nr:lectin BRA-3-like [Mytilus californianus]
MRHHNIISFLTIFSFWWITDGNLILVDIYTKENIFSDIMCNDGKLITLKNTRSALICAKVCALASTCVSFFFNRSGTCQLHNVSVSDTVGCIKHSDTSYYVLKDFKPETTTTSNIAPTSVELLSSSETTILPFQTTSRPLSCDPDWLLIDASCYRITPPDTITKQEWQNASEICKNNGGYLATLETADENQLVKDYVGSLGSKDFFIGGSDLQTEGTFLWEHSGVLINLHGSGLFYDWMSTNQPDNGNGNQHCMVLAGRYGHKWNDVQCTVARAFICEKDPA